MTQVKLGDKSIPFIYQGDKLLYPNPVKDGLLLWTDFKGLNNESYEKQWAENFADGSRNNKLNNFAYSSGSGYNNGLQFDGIDDFVGFNDLTTKKFEGKDKFTFDFTITFTNSNKGGAVFCLPMSPRDDGSKRLIVKVTEDKEIVIGLFDGLWKAKKTIPIDKQKVNVVITFDGMVGKDFNVKIYVNGVILEEVTNSVEMSEYYGHSYNYLVIGWQGTNAIPENAFLKEVIHSAKIYDKVLNDQEIQHNYQLEKERWGL
ncbi:LamG-like jellyroll fold domain-containing protein [Staphylococcus saprophyticus]